jgi:hypothetical protein
MDVLAHVVLTGLEGEPVDAAVALEVYDLRQHAWRGIADALKPLRTTATVKNERGRYEISFTLPPPMELSVIGAFFRLVAGAAREGAPAQVILASQRIVSDPRRIDLDFGTALYLGEAHGFVAIAGDRGIFAAAVALPGEDGALAAAQRRFYASPLGSADDAPRAGVAPTTRPTELERAVAELRKALADGQATVAQLTSANAALVKQAESAAALLQAQAGEKAQLTQQLTAETARAAAAKADLKACTEERARLVAELAARSRDLAATTAELEACRRAGAEAEQRAHAAEQARIALNDRLLALSAEQELRAAELAELRERAAGGQVEVLRLRDTLIEATAKAKVAADQLEAVREQHRLQLPAAQLVTNLAASFGEAGRGLIAADIPYRLGRTDIRFRTFVGGAGDLMYLPDAAYSAEHPAISEVSIELIPDAPTAPAAGGLVVPNLLGLTETAAIRVLSSLFLKADKAVEAIVGEPEKHGRALHQVPQPGAAAERGQTVLVVYGAEEES